MSEQDIKEASEQAQDFDANAVAGVTLSGGMLKGEALEKFCGGLLHSDLGNAKRLIARFGNDLAFVREWGWLAWTGTHWSPDEGIQLAHKRAHETALAIFREAKQLEKDGPRQDEGDEKHLKRVVRQRQWATVSSNSGRLKAMLEVAAPYLTRQVEDFDAHPDLLNVKNGTLELTGEISLRPHRRDDFLTKMAETAFDFDASCPHFKAFLSVIMPDADSQVFLQRYLGYALTGRTSEQALLLCHGTGSNGKSTLMDTLIAMLGDYALTLNFASLLHDERRRGGEASPDIARLAGARFVVAAEPETGARFSESMIKSLTGGEKIAARFLNQEFFEFKPQFKLCLSFNNKPSVRGQDDGIWRRLLMLPFTQFIPAAARDKSLAEKLHSENAGILNWLLDGVRLWQERGLEVPAVVREATESYRAENDPVGQFLDQCTRPCKGNNIPAKWLYDAFIRWCKQNAITEISGTAFGRRVKGRGVQSLKTNRIYYCNIELTEEAQSDLSQDPSTA